MGVGGWAAALDVPVSLLCFIFYKRVWLKRACRILGTALGKRSSAVTTRMRSLCPGTSSERGVDHSGIRLSLIPPTSSRTAGWSAGEATEPYPMQPSRACVYIVRPVKRGLVRVVQCGLDWSSGRIFFDRITPCTYTSIFCGTRTIAFVREGSLWRYLCQIRLGIHVVVLGKHALKDEVSEFIRLILMWSLSVWRRTRPDLCLA